MPELERVPMTEVGSTGLRAWGGIVMEEQLKQLQNPQRRYQLYREMRDNDAIVGGVLLAVQMLIRQVEWKTVPFTEDPASEPQAGDIAQAKFVDGAFKDLQRPWTSYLAEFLSFLEMGWDWHEIVFKERNGPQREGSGVPSSRYNDGLIGWHKFASRSQDTLDRWAFDDTGDVVGIWQNAPPKYNKVFIPRSKSLHFVTVTSSGNPEGKSFLRNAYRAYYLRKSIEEIFVIGIERDLAGLPVLWVPEELMRTTGLTPEETALRGQLEQMVRNIRRGQQEGILLPKRVNTTPTGAVEEVYKLELLTTGGRRQFNVREALDYYDRQIAQTALADFMMLGHTTNGSFALANAKNHIFTLAIYAWLDVVSDEFSRRAIPQLLRVNGMDETRPPTLSHGEIESVDLMQLGTYIRNLASAGLIMFPSTDGQLEQHLLDAADVPSNSEL